MLPLESRQTLAGISLSAIASLYISLGAGCSQQPSAEKKMPEIPKTSSSVVEKVEETKQEDNVQDLTSKVSAAMKDLGVNVLVTELPETELKRFGGVYGVEFNYKGIVQITVVKVKSVKGFRDTADAIGSIFYRGLNNSCNDPKYPFFIVDNNELNALSQREQCDIITALCHQFEPVSFLPDKPYDKKKYDLTTPKGAAISAFAAIQKADIDMYLRVNGRFGATDQEDLEELRGFLTKGTLDGQDFVKLWLKGRKPSQCELSVEYCSEPHPLADFDPIYGSEARVRYVIKDRSTGEVLYKDNTSAKRTKKTQEWHISDKLL